MQNIFINKTIALQSGQVATLHIDGPIHVQVASGRVWVTMEGCLDDYWLDAGQQADIAGYGMLVMEAADGSTQLQVGLPSQHWLQRMKLGINALLRLAGRRFTGRSHEPVCRG